MSAIDVGETRRVLLEAGGRLAERSAKIGDLTAVAIAREAAVSEQVFHEAFTDLEDFRRELLVHLMDMVRAEVLGAAASVPNKPGFERMWHTVEAFLDANLRHPAMRSLAYELRTDPASIDLRRKRSGGYAMVFRVELAAIGRPDAAAAARLSAAMIVEAAVAESELGHAQPEMRRAMYAFLKGYCG